MTEAELKIMAERFIQKKRAYEKARMDAIDAKSLLSPLNSQRSSWAGELDKDAHGAQTGPGLNPQNVMIAARVEAEFRRDSEKCEALTKAAETAKAEMLSAWEAIVGASL